METLDGLKDGPNLHPLQRAFMEHFAAQCGYCTPGMLMAAKALLDRNPSPTPRRGRRRDRRQYLPLHRLRADHQRRARRRLAAARTRLKDRAMLELRKDIFADERDDNLKEIGKRHAAPGHARPCHRHARTYFDDHQLAGHAASEGAAQPARACPHPRASTPRRRSARPACARIIRGADVPRNLNTLLSLINFGKDDEPSLAVDKVRYKGEPIVAIVADSEREAFEAHRQGARRLRAAARGVRRRGGAEGRRAGRQRDLSEEHLHLSRHL